MRTHILLAAMFIAFGAAAAAAAEDHGLDLSAMDTSVRPGDDFFAYANGNWVKRTEIPPDQGRWGSFTMLREKAAKRTADLIREAAASNPPAGSNARKVGDYYASFMDEAAIEKAGLSPLKADLARVAALKDKTALARFLGETLRADVDIMNSTNFYTENLFGLWTAPALDDPRHYAAYLLQGGLGMPDREYYLGERSQDDGRRAPLTARTSPTCSSSPVAEADERAGAVICARASNRRSARQPRRFRGRAEGQQSVARRANSPRKAPGLDWAAFFAGARPGRAAHDHRLAAERRHRHRQAGSARGRSMPGRTT